jgi:hypothetical protein
MRTAILLTVLALGAAHAAEPEARRTIDLAICLDTSGSMQGLIDSARQRIWSIVNDLALAKPLPRLRVALLSYGNDGHAADKGWVSVETDFTEDLDLVSQRLFAYTTNGGTELVGRVLKASLDQLSWQEDKGALRLIVVAGNESADQDAEVPYRDVCRKAIARGILVNSIYCGPAADEIAPGWKEIALLADGHYASIDQNTGTVTIATPLDARLQELSTALNATYVPFGATGGDGLARQKAEDGKNAGLNADAAAGRAQSKASPLYFCNWCLADAVKANQVKLEEMKPEDLPEGLRGQTVLQIRAFLDGKLGERAKVQEEIQKVHAQRATFIAEEMAKRGQEDDKSFDAAVRQAIRAQAAAKGYAFPGN